MYRSDLRAFLPKIFLFINRFLHAHRLWCRVLHRWDKTWQDKAVQYRWDDQQSLSSHFLLIWQDFSKNYFSINFLGREKHFLSTKINLNGAYINICHTRLLEYRTITSLYNLLLAGECPGFEALRMIILPWSNRWYFCYSMISLWNAKIQWLLYDLSLKKQICHRCNTMCQKLCKILLHYVLCNWHFILDSQIKSTI